MKKMLRFALAITLAVSMLSACAKTEAPKANTETEKQVETASDNDKVLVSIGDYQMPKKEANIYLYSTKLSVERMGLDPTIWVNEVQEGKTFEAMQLEQLKTTLTYAAIMNEEARKRNLTLTDEETAVIEKNAEDIFKSFSPALNQHYGFTKEEFANFYKTQRLIMKVFEDEMKDYKVDEAKLNELFEGDQTHKKIMEVGLDHYFDQVRARHILISTIDKATNTPLPEEKKAEAKKKAEEILAKAKAGDDFAELAKEYSEDPGSKDNGGEYTFGYGKMVPEFETAAFSLKPGEISDLVETNFGYHIIKVEEKIASTPEDIEKAKDLEKQIKADYESRLKAEAFQAKYEENVKNYDVKFDEDLFNTLSLSYTVPEETPSQEQNQEKPEEKPEEKPDSK